jgi:hypothetical protein
MTTNTLTRLIHSWVNRPLRYQPFSCGSYCLRATCFVIAVAYGVSCSAPEASAAPFLPGDVDGNGIVNGADIDLLASTIGSTTQLDGDVNLDGVVDIIDFDQWFQLYSADSGVPLAIALIDVNFDQANTQADYSTIFANLSQLTSYFTRGNLDGNSLVNQADLDLYLSRGGIVPEPTTAILAAVAILGFTVRRNRRAPLRG